MSYLTQKLIENIKAGGLIIAPCMAGKTTAITTVMKEDLSYILIAPYSYQLQSDVKELQGRVFDPFRVKQQVFEFKELYYGKKILLDEAFTDSMRPLFWLPWYTAITTSIFPVTLYSQDGDCLKLDTCTLADLKKE